MDEYQRKSRRFHELTAEEQACQIEGMKAQCICGRCPSYDECACSLLERLYCIQGRSPECIADELGCVCPDCPVARAYGMVNQYYCTSGSEKELRCLKRPR